MVNPLIELAIIFLPNILAFINEGRQREQLRQKIVTEVIPSVKRELRDRLPALLSEQMDALVTQVSSEFEREISEKQSVINEISSNRQQTAQAAEQQIEHLTRVGEALRKLASETLYELQA